MPAQGAAVPELRIARVRSHARRLIWPALVLIAVAGATGYFTDNLPDPYENWMLWAAAAAVVVLLVVIPFLRWWGRSFTVTTRRVIARSGIFAQHRTELTHARGYTIAERRGIVQRIWGAGTLTLANGIDAPIKMANIGSVRLMHEVLADQVEVSQILAHRDAPSLPIIPPLPTTPLPRSS